jgi:alanine-synthesizing transaminase
VPATRSDEDLALELLATQNVYIHPGHFYDFPSEGHLVLSLLAPSQTFREGLRSLLFHC